jgi:hypothetical protein
MSTILNTPFSLRGDRMKKLYRRGFSNGQYKISGPRLESRAGSINTDWVRDRLVRYTRRVGEPRLTLNNGVERASTQFVVTRNWNHDGRVRRSLGLFQEILDRRWGNLTFENKLERRVYTKWAVRSTSGRNLFVIVTTIEYGDSYYGRHRDDPNQISISLFLSALH